MDEAAEKVGALAGAVLMASCGGVGLPLNGPAVLLVLFLALLGAFIGGAVGKFIHGSSGNIAEQDLRQPERSQPAVSPSPPKQRPWTAEKAGALAGAVLVAGFFGVGLHLSGFVVLFLALLGAFVGGAAGKIITDLVGPKPPDKGRNP